VPAAFEQAEGAGDDLARIVVAVGRARGFEGEWARAAQVGSSAGRPLSSAMARARALVWRSHMPWM
jgi:hypothetical protein